VKDPLPGGARERCRGGEEAVAKGLGFPPAGVVPGQGEQSHPRQEVVRELDDEEPDAVVVEALQREVVQPGVLRDPNAVFAAGPAAVAHFEVGELALTVLVTNAVSR